MAAYNSPFYFWSKYSLDDDFHGNHALLPEEGWDNLDLADAIDAENIPPVPVGVQDERRVDLGPIPRLIDFVRPIEGQRVENNREGDEDFPPDLDFNQIEERGEALTMFCEMITELGVMTGKSEAPVLQVLGKRISDLPDIIFYDDLAQLLNELFDNFDELPASEEDPIASGLQQIEGFFLQNPNYLDFLLKFCPLAEIGEAIEDIPARPRM